MTMPITSAFKHFIVMNSVRTNYTIFLFILENFTSGLFLMYIMGYKYD